MDAAYRQDLREQNDLNWGRVEARISQSEARAEARMGQSEARVEARMAEMEASMAQMEARLRADMQIGFEKLRSDLLKWMFLFWTGTALTVIGLSLR